LSYALLNLFHICAIWCATSELINPQVCLYFVVDENDDEGDYDNVQGRLTVAVDRSAVDVNNARSVTNAETGSAIHSNPTAMETVTASETTRQSGTTKAKKEKKMFSWGQKKKKKPRTAAGKHYDCSD